MKQKVLGMMSGALMCLSLVFSSCGNVDNPLEELANTNAVAAQLKDALADGAVITITFNLNGEQTITFKKGEDGYEYDGPEADNMRYHLDYDDENGLLVLDVRGEEASLASQIILNPKDNSFYIINNFGYNTTSDGTYSVNGVEGTLTNSCPDKATIQLGYKENLECRAGTRNAGPSYPVEGYRLVDELVVRYKAGETWQSVIDRYTNSVFNYLLKKGGDPADPNIKVSKDVSSEFSEYPGQRDFTLRYDIETKVLPSHVVGMKDDVALSTEFKYPALCYYDQE
jgi:hypothetical protein